MSEFAFDVLLSAVLRVQADTEEEARTKIEEMQGVEANEHVQIDKLPPPDLRITEVSAIINDESPKLSEPHDPIVHLFEVDGRSVE